ncbi:MAG: hypothetical protein U0324_21945 [Polyangiales bacterium]
MKTDDVGVGDSALNRVVARAFKLLLALARAPRLLGAMRKRGFTADEQARGWALIDAIAGRGAVEAPQEELDETVETAIERVDQWVTVNVPVMKAALRHRHTAQHDFLFGGGVGVAHGPDAVRVASTLSVRLDAMEKSPERAASRADDHAALDTLTARGVTADERRRVAARIQLIQRAGSPTDGATGAAGQSIPPSADDPRLALYVWFSEWSEIARAVVTRRADLIKLGLASPRRERASSDDENDDEGDDDAPDEAAAKDAAAPAKDAVVKAAPARPKGTPSSAPSPA